MNRSRNRRIAERNDGRRRIRRASQAVGAAAAVLTGVLGVSLADGTATARSADAATPPSPVPA
ncbi:hypothetical protein, partial [Pseudonocardia acidicola]|uniref:hypothetical protein n=1 Tax=Pseudonocardia acidicola TaxID=2724939 RepID=UPI001B7CE033